MMKLLGLLPILLAVSGAFQKAPPDLPSWFGYVDSRRVVAVADLGFPGKDELLAAVSKPSTEWDFPPEVRYYLKSYVAFREGTLQKLADKKLALGARTSVSEWFQVFIFAELMKEGKIEANSKNSWLVSSSLGAFNAKVHRDEKLLSVLAASVESSYTNYRKARSIMRDLVVSYPHDRALWHYLAVVQESGVVHPGVPFSKDPGLDFAGAIKTRERIKDAWPDFDRNLLSLAMDYDILGKKDTAKAILKQAIAQHKTNDALLTRMKGTMEYFLRGGWHDTTQ